MTCSRIAGTRIVHGPIHCDCPSELEYRFHSRIQAIGPNVLCNSDQWSALPDQLHRLKDEIPRMRVANPPNLPASLTRRTVPRLRLPIGDTLQSVTARARLHLILGVLGDVRHDRRESARHCKQAQMAHVIGIKRLRLVETDIEPAQERRETAPAVVWIVEGM